MQPPVRRSDITVAGIRDINQLAGGVIANCTINGHYRTRVFEFPQTILKSRRRFSHAVYSSGPIKAHITTEVASHFTNSSGPNHYKVHPSLRVAVDEALSDFQSKDGREHRVFLVIEEVNQLTPICMPNGECSVWDEMIEIDGELVPRLVGGREGKKFLMAWETTDGSWPTLPNNQLAVNMILAAVRADRQATVPIRKYIDQECLITDNGRFVVMMRAEFSARLSTTTPVSVSGLTRDALALASAILAIEREISEPHVALLVNSIYSDEWKDDTYQRLWYLRMWQSLAEAGNKYLAYPGSIAKDSVAVAGTKTLSELSEYRDDIAHWWTDRMDGNYLAGLQSTINELIRRKYF